MAVNVQLQDPAATYAFQEQIPAYVVFLRDEGQTLTAVPRPVQDPRVLTLRMRHEDGSVEDLSPKPPAEGPPRPPPELLRSKLPEEKVEMNLEPPPRPGKWTIEAEVRIGADAVKAPPVELTVLEPTVLAVVAAAAVHEPGGLDRLLQLAPRGQLIEHTVGVAGPGEVLMSAGARRDLVDGPVSALRVGAALPGGKPDPMWLVIARGAEVSARRLERKPKSSPSVKLHSDKEPPPVWLGQPLVLDNDASKGRMVLAWASGNALRVATFAAAGGAPKVAEVALPGLARGGVLLAHPKGGATVLVQVIEPPQPLPERKALVWLGSVEDLPGARDADKRPMHAEYLYLARLSPDGAKLAPPARVAAAPASTVAWIGHSGKAKQPGALWGIERRKDALDAWQLPIALDEAKPGQPARKDLKPGRKITTDPAALTCTPTGVRLAFLEPDGVVIAETGGRALTVPFGDARPDFVGFVRGRPIVHDTVHGVHFLETQ